MSRKTTTNVSSVYLLSLFSLCPFPGFCPGQFQCCVLSNLFANNTDHCIRTCDALLIICLPIWSSMSSNLCTLYSICLLRCFFLSYKCRHRFIVDSTFTVIFVPLATLWPDTWLSFDRVLLISYPIKMKIGHILNSQCYFMWYLLYGG